MVCFIYTVDTGFKNLFLGTNLYLFICIAIQMKVKMKSLLIYRI